jgi:hypothetical protein
MEYRFSYSVKNFRGENAETVKRDPLTYLLVTCQMISVQISPILVARTLLKISKGEKMLKQEKRDIECEP